MATSIYVGNLSFSSTQAGLENLFSQYGTPLSVNLIMDRVTGRPRGFGFVEMEEDDSPQCHRLVLNGVEFEGRTLRVNEAEKRPAPRRW